MAPKKAAVTPAEPPSTETPVEEKVEKKTDAAALRKLPTHPSTAIMVREALKELDSRKGVSSQAIQNYIKQKYPLVDLVRLKHFVRRALIKGIENGTFVRPANSTVTTGATGKFRLAPKNKGLTTKAENVDPNVLKAPKVAKEGAKGEAKKPKKPAAKKKAASKEDKSSEEPKATKRSKSKDEEGSSSKVAPAKKPKAKKAETEEGDSESVKPKRKAAKATEEKEEKGQKLEKPGKAAQSKSKPAKADGNAPVAKAQGKRGKKAAE